MSKHTPGPWKAVARNYPIADTGDYDGFWEVLTSDPKKPIVQIWGDSDEDEANASLIAAAPDLLEAAKLVIAWFEAEDDHSKADFYQRIEMCRTSEAALRAAVAKAEGEQT
jgi:hypothetical protein